MLLTLNEMHQAPVIGLYNSEIINIANKIAESYNNSVKDVNYNHFLGYNFKMIPELAGCSGSYNFDDRILEIHYNKYTSFVLPSAYSDFTHISKYFDIKECQEYKQELFLESLDKRRKIYETLSLKGSGGRIARTASKLAKKVKKTIFRNDIEIKSTESLNELSADIMENVSKILGYTPDASPLSVEIKKCIENPTANSVQSLYDFIFDSNIESKYAKVYKEKFESFLSKIEKEGDYPGETLEKKAVKIVADAYNTKVGTILALNGHDRAKDWAETFFTAFSKLEAAFSSAINGIKTLLLGGATLTIGTKGFLTGSVSIISTLLSSFLGFIKWIGSFNIVKKQLKKNAEAGAGGDSDQSLLDQGKELFLNPGDTAEKVIEKGLKGIDWFHEKIDKLHKNPEGLKDDFMKTMNDLISTVSDEIIQGFKAAWNYSLEKGVDFANNLQEEFFNGLSLGTNLIDETTVGKSITAFVMIFLTFYLIKRLLKLFNKLRVLLGRKKTNNNELATTFRYDKLISNQGFDKFVVTLGITGILQETIAKAVSNKDFNKQETANLKLLSKQINSVSRKRCKEGIKFIVKEVK